MTKSQDISRRDISFDAVLVGGAGVGIKTFVAGARANSKNEKVAEFAKDATSGLFSGMNHEERAIAVAGLRNARILSDTSELGLNASRAFYHCLIRRPNVAFVHEEAYESIDINSIYPTDKFGKKIPKFPISDSGHVYFSDGNNTYTYNVSKNVLLKKFNLNAGYNSDEFPTPIDLNIWEKLLGEPVNDNFADDLESLETEELDRVVLPLYSTRSSESKVVPEKSGINQWHAGGRARKFGEAYVPVPMAIHKLKPHFFPDREVSFKVKLPTGVIIDAKLCQENSKALMSAPNDVLLDWLYASIDGSLSIAEKRIVTGTPYKYEDLAVVGKDSVEVIRTPDGEADYELSLAPVGSYEEFLDG